MSSARPKIVLADDTPASLATWKDLLEKTCRIAGMGTDGPSALAAIRRFKPDAAVLDIHMPELNGLDVARTAIAEQPGLGVILCSVLHDEGIIHAAADAGVRGYVFKTRLLEDLPRAVAAVAAGGRFLLQLDAPPTGTAEVEPPPMPPPAAEDPDCSETEAALSEAERNAAGSVVRVRGTVQDITERRQAEQKLREYERAVEGVEEMIVVVDREFRFVIANRAFLDFHRQTADRVIGHPVSEIVGKDIFENVIRKNLEASFNGQPVRFEVTSTRTALGPRTVFATHLPVDGPRGVERVVAILQDMTNLKNAEEELRERESALREAQRIAHIGSWAWDPRTDAVTWSDEIFALAKWDHKGSAPTFRDHEQLFNPEDFRKLNEAVQKTLCTGDPYEVVMQGMRADGVKAWFICRGEAVYGADGTVDHLRGTVQDITERHLADVALKESEERFRTIANTAPVMIWMADAENRATYVNKQWLEFTGTTFESQLGHGWAGCIHPEDASAVTQEFSKAFGDRAAVTLRYRLRRNDGEYRWVIDTAVPSFDADGSFTGYIGSCVDDTERRAGEEALRSLSGRLIQAQEEERKRIARELHDDLNQRLSMLALEMAKLRNKRGLTLEQINHELAELLKRVTDISFGVQTLSHRLHSSSLEYLGLAAAIKGFCDEIVRHQKVSIDYQHHHVPRSLPSDVSLALFRITQEALQNAIKYSGVRRFAVRLVGSSDQVQLTVRDDGAGFALEDAMHGPGLGLVSMRERVAALRGTLSVHSAPKRGTQVRASVPISTPGEDFDELPVRTEEAVPHAGISVG